MMGTWSDGLYDSDAALGHLAECLQDIPLDVDATHLATGLGLLVWMLPSHVQVHAAQYADLIERRSDWVDTLPSDAQAALCAFTSDPEAFSEGGERSPELRDVLGGHACGPRHDALLTVPGADRVLRRTGDQIAVQLDELLLGHPTLAARAGSLARLGPLLYLAVDGSWAPDPRRVSRWRELFDEASARTTGERAFWDGYVRRVRHGFDILARHARSRTTKAERHP